MYWGLCSLHAGGIAGTTECSPVIEAVEGAIISMPETLQKAVKSII
jgi:hypothetical protein